MFRLKTILILTLIIGSQATIASAASISKSFKLTVTIPASVAMTHNTRHANDAAQAKARDSQIVQEHQTVRNNSPVTIQSIVIL